MVFGDTPSWKTSFKPDVEGYKGATPYMALFYEIIASALFIIIGTNGSSELNGALQWAVAFVVVTIVFKDSHVNSWITFYKIFVGQENLIHGLMLIGAQFFGAFIAASISKPFGLSADLTLPEGSEDTIGTFFEIGNWQTGLKECICLSIFLWCWLHAQGGNTGDMPKQIFLLLVVTVTFLFFPDTAFTFSRYFGSAANIVKCGPYVLWGFVAVVTTHVKRVLVGLEGRWFFQDA
jgi:hypothetical protein